jgi:hypothetical protein
MSASTQPPGLLSGEQLSVLLDLTKQVFFFDTADLALNRRRLGPRAR